MKIFEVVLAAGGVSSAVLGGAGGPVRELAPERRVACEQGPPAVTEPRGQQLGRVLEGAPWPAMSLPGSDTPARAWPPSPPTA